MLFMHNDGIGFNDLCAALLGVWNGSTNHKCVNRLKFN
jgi:hypothetical protein